MFCGIIAARSEASVVHEDEHVVAFMDIEPVTDGHLLVVHVVPRTAGGGFTIDARWRRRDRAELDAAAQRVRRGIAALAT